MDLPVNIDSTSVLRAIGMALAPEEFSGSNAYHCDKYV